MSAEKENIEIKNIFEKNLGTGVGAVEYDNLINRGTHPIMMYAYIGDLSKLSKLKNLNEDEIKQLFLIKDNLGNNLLMYAFEGGNEKVINFALDLAKNHNVLKDIVNSQNSAGRTILHAATIKNLESVVDFLLLQGANPNIKNADGDTPIFNAVWNDNLNVLSLLESRGADLNEVNNDKQNILMVAVKYTFSGIIEKALKVGVSVNSQDIKGKTALHYAYEFGEVDSVELLYNYFAQDGVKDSKGKIPTDYMKDDSEGKLAEAMKRFADTEKKKHMKLS